MIWKRASLTEEEQSACCDTRSGIKSEDSINQYQATERTKERERERGGARHYCFFSLRKTLNWSHPDLRLSILFIVLCLRTWSWNEREKSLGVWRLSAKRREMVNWQGNDVLRVGKEQTRATTPAPAAAAGSFNCLFPVMFCFAIQINGGVGGAT